MRPADLRSELIISNAMALVEAMSRDMAGDMPQSRAYDFMSETWIEEDFTPAANLLGVAK